MTEMPSAAAPGATPQQGFVGRTLAVWRAELEVARHWPGGMWHLIRRMIGLLVFDAFALWLITRFLPGISVSSIFAAAGVVAIMGAINVIIRPIVFVLVRGHDYLTILATLTVDTVTILLAGALDVGLSIDGFLPAFVTGLLLTVLHSIVAAVFELDESETFQRNVMLGWRGTGWWRERPMSRALSCSRSMGSAHRCCAPSFARARCRSWRAGCAVARTNCSTGSARSIDDLGKSGGILHGITSTSPLFAGTRRTARS
jgi:putative membrane protein